MTKAELISALVGLPDTAEIFTTCVASTNNFDSMIDQARDDWLIGDGNTELSAILGLRIIEADEPDSPTFGIIEHHLEYLPSRLTNE